MIKRIKTLAYVSAAFVALSAAGATTVAAQENLLQMLRSDVRADAQQITAVAMDLSEADAQKFWGIYRDYEMERSKWTDTRLAMIRSYAENYETMNDETAEGLADSAFELLNARLALYEEFYNRFAAEVGASTALRWVQVENQLNLIIDLQFAHEVPLVFNADGGN